MFQSGTPSREFPNTEILSILSAQETVDNKRDSKEGLTWHWSVAGNSEKQALGAADEGTTAFVEAEELIGGAGDADSNAFYDGADGVLRHAKPERAGSTKIDAVIAAVDLKGSGKAAGAAR